MGYTHDWTVPDDFTDEEFMVIRKAAAKLFTATHVKIETEFTSKHITCNGIGDNSHEDFFFPKSSNEFNFCKTARKPYDIVVAGLLATIKHLYPEKITVNSDGNMDDVEWQDALKFASKTLKVKIPYPAR